MGIKQRIFFFEKKIQNGRLQKTEFFNSPNSQYFFQKIQRLVLGLIGLIDVTGIDVAQPNMVIRLSDVSSKTA
jgi:hypothetical protein